MYQAFHVILYVPSVPVRSHGLRVTSHLDPQPSRLIHAPNSNNSETAGDIMVRYPLLFNLLITYPPTAPHSPFTLCSPFFAYVISLSTPRNTKVRICTIDLSPIQSSSLTKSFASAQKAGNLGVIIMNCRLRRHNANGVRVRCRRFRIRIIDLSPI